MQLNGLKVPKQRKQTGWDCPVLPSPLRWWLWAEVWWAVPEQHSDVHTGFYLLLEQVHKQHLGQPSSAHQLNTEAITEKSGDKLTGSTCRESHIRKKNVKGHTFLSGLLPPLKLKTCFQPCSLAWFMRLSCYRQQVHYYQLQIHTSGHLSNVACVNKPIWSCSSSPREHEASVTFLGVKPSSNGKQLKIIIVSVSVQAHTILHNLSLIRAHLLTVTSTIRPEPLRCTDFGVHLPFSLSFCHSFQSLLSSWVLLWLALTRAFFLPSLVGLFVSKTCMNDTCCTKATIPKRKTPTFSFSYLFICSAFNRNI